MKKLMFVLFSALLALGVASPAMAQQGPPSQTYFVDLDPLNDSGVTGVVILTVDGDQLTVAVIAAGLEPGRPHPQHIHGFANNQNATCPGANADADRNGLISLMEGQPAYGPVQLPFEPFPTADANGIVFFVERYRVSDAITPLQNMAVVLHGMTVNGTYEATLPVACGQVQMLPGGGR